MEVTEENRSLLENLIVSAAAGSEAAIRQLHHGLTQKLVMVPVVRLQDYSQVSGPVFFDPYVEGVCTLLICDGGGDKILPIFATRALFDEWLSQYNLQIEGLPLYAPDVAKILSENVLMIINPNTDLEFILDAALLRSFSNDHWIGSSTGLYRELSLVGSNSDPSSLSEERAVVNEEPPVENESPPIENEEETLIQATEEPNAPASIVKPPPVSTPKPDLDALEKRFEEILSAHQIGQLPLIEVPASAAPKEVGGRQRAPSFCIGVDEINFKKDEFLEHPESLEPKTGYSRERQGTFSKVLDMLRKYRNQP